MNRIRFYQQETMNRMQFNGDWMPEVEKWAEDHSAMIARYDALQTYRKMQMLAEELTPVELHQFYSVESRESQIEEEDGLEDIFWEDRPEES